MRWILPGRTWYTNGRRTRIPTQTLLEAKCRNYATEAGGTSTSHLNRRFLPTPLVLQGVRSDASEIWAFEEGSW